MTRLLTTALGALPLAAFCLWSFRHATAPFCWIGLAIAVYCAWAFRRTRTTGGKIVWLNLGVFAATVAVLEILLWWSSAPSGSFDPEADPKSRYAKHADYGYGPVIPSRIRARKIEGGKTLYDVTYTIDEKGLRVSPPELPPGERRGCVLFFGCSNTFGEGVRDDETLPWQVGVKSAGRFATRNFSFSGWGPHQMLAALQNGDAERAARCKVTHVMHVALFGHAIRVAGRASWDRAGPRFVLDADGRALRAGNFSDGPRHTFTRAILDRGWKSYLYGRLLARHVDPFERPVTPAELDLHAAIIARARDEAASRFPGVSFDVLFLDMGQDPEPREAFTSRLTARGIRVHSMSQAIPDYVGSVDPRYVISQADRHPAPRAYARIADYVVDRILSDGP
jgi:hypothetical protein